jgi:hypothetical protein
MWYNLFLNSFILLFKPFFFQKKNLAISVHISLGLHKVKIIKIYLPKQNKCANIGKQGKNQQDPEQLRPKKKRH